MATINTSAILTTTSVNHPQYYYQFQIIYKLLIKFSFPYIFLIAFIGLITNTSTVILLSKNYITKNLKNKWTLIALALSDLLFNIALLIRGIHDIIKGRSENICLIISFLSHLAEILSACYTVLFTIQRYTAVRHPFKAVADRHSSPIISLIITFLGCSIFCCILSRLNTYVDCHEELVLSWFIADALISFVIPFSLILIFNILIVNFIRKHSRSSITFQSTLLRKKKQFKTSFKTSLHDENYETDNNTITNIMATYTHIDENDIGDIKSKKDEKTSSIEMEQRPSISFSLNRVNSETSSNHNQSQPAFSRSNSSKLASNNKKCFSFDSNTQSLTEKSLQSNDAELVRSISTRTSQSIRLTRMLILVSTCFLLLNAPAHLCIIALKVYTTINDPPVHEPIQQTNNQSKPFVFHTFHNETTSSTIEHGVIVEDQIGIHILYMAVSVTHLIAYASYSINFFLYSFSGIAFRTNLRQLIEKFRRH